MSKKDDVLYYHGDGITRVLIEDMLERMSETDRLNLAARLGLVKTEMRKKNPDLQKAALNLQQAWEYLRIKYLAPPPGKKSSGLPQP